ncbi:hypothetical protein [Streptomyces virginiae]
MPTFTTCDGTELAHHLQGDAEPPARIPGGAVRASAYLGDLGGRAAGRLPILLDLRGTGDSAVPADTAVAAYERILAGAAHGEEDREPAAPVFYANGDGAARAHWAANARQQDEKAAEAYAFAVRVERFLAEEGA